MSRACMFAVLCIGAILVLSPTVLRAEEGGQSQPPTLKDAREDDREDDFLKLGEHADYLKEERWRIVDQIEQAIPPLYEPVRPFHGYTLPPGAFRVGLNTNIGHNPGDFGTDDFYASFFNKVKVDFLQLNVDLSYGFEFAGVRDIMVVLNLPYKFQQTKGTGHPFRIDPMTMTMDGSGAGLGDMSLTFKKKWIDQGNGPLTFSTMLGVIFPTAEDDQEFDESQTIFVNGAPMMAVSGLLPMNPAIDVFSTKPGERLFPRPGQPGNGAWGARIGFGATRQFERSALHAGAIFDFLADTDNDITPGDELKYGVSYTLPPTSSDHLTLDLGVFGLWKGNEKFPGTIMHPVRDPATGGPIMDAGGNMVLFTTGRPDFEHGHALYVSPSLIYVPTPNVRLFVSPAYRVLEPDKGPSPEWMVNFGITVTF